MGVNMKYKTNSVGVQWPEELFERERERDPDLFLWDDCVKPVRSWTMQSCRIEFANESDTGRCGKPAVAEVRSAKTLWFR